MERLRSIRRQTQHPGAVQRVDVLRQTSVDTPSPSGLAKSPAGFHNPDGCRTRSLQEHEKVRMCPRTRGTRQTVKTSKRRLVNDAEMASILARATNPDDVLTGALL